MPDPHEETCPKCGSGDIHRRFEPEGKRLFSSQQSSDRTSTDFVDRSVHTTYDLVLKDCIMHHCRCCGFGWDGPTRQDRNAQVLHDTARRLLKI